MSLPNSRESQAADTEATSLATLRADQAPGRDLWAGIAARIADPAERDHLELDAAIGAELRALRRDAAPAQDLWAGVAQRIADPALRDQLALPETLRTALPALRHDQAPARDLWAGVVARIERRPPRRRQAMGWAAAASLAASLLVVFALVVDRDVAPANVGPVASAKAPLRPSAEVFAATLGYTRGGEEAAALRRAGYRPISRETRALVRANLKIVNTAEAQIEKALAADPDDAAYLQALLDSARQHQQGLRAALVDHP